MAKINVLDSSVYNKISAGEVVEKPASVVKELIENSLDAGATDIVVKISNGGITFIEVADNGCGIEKDQIKKVFLPHATSKIKDAKDLESITSLGFRGEAMASIASVSMVTLETSTGEGIAYKVDCDGGKLSEISQTTRGKGTTITVRNLFYNTPARLKFLRKDKSEERDIVSIIEKIAFANPFVRIEFSTENGLVFKTNGEDLKDTIQCIYGKEISANLLELHAEQYGMRMKGFISNTSYSKPTRNYQTFIVNGRVVNNVSLVTALNNVYVDFFVKRTYPFCIISLTLPPDELDVNVHPAKTEIRFEFQSKVYSFVQRNVKKCLEDSLHEKNIMFGDMCGVISDEWITPFSGKDESKNSATQSNPLFDDEFESGSVDLSKIQDAKNRTYQQDKADAYRASLSHEDGITISIQDYFNIGKSISDNSSFDESKSTQNNFNTNINENAQISFIKNEDSVSTPSHSIENKPSQNKISVDDNSPVLDFDYRIVGQIFGTYIILEFPDYVMLIDQHAAAEYKLYSKFLNMINQNRLEIQPMLLPLPLDLDNETINQFEDKIELLSQIGIEVRKIDDLHYEITAIPTLLQEIDSKSLIANLLSEDAVDLPLKERLMYKACRSAIKGNTHLDNEAVDIFIKSMFSDGMFPKCPHGRPSYVKISKAEIEKLFLRIV